MQAYAPSKVIDKGNAGPGLLAHIIMVPKNWTANIAK